MRCWYCGIKVAPAGAKMERATGFIVCEECIAAAAAVRAKPAGIDCDCGEPWCSGGHLTDGQLDAVREVNSHA